MKTDLSRQLDKWADKWARGTARALARLAAEVQLDVQFTKHPVDSGWSRASWHLVLNDPNAAGVYNYKTGHFTRTNKKAKGLKPPRGAAVAPPPPRKLNPKPGDRIYLVNNVSYIKFLESRIGMVKMAMQRLRRKTARLLREELR